VVDDTVYVGGGNKNVYALDVADGTERWSFGGADAAQSSPAVANGAVYIGSRDSNVYALDARDGSELWSFQTDDIVQSAPAMVDSTVYVGSNDSNVYALDAADGTERWSVQTGGRVRSSPAVANGTVYVGSHDGHVYALVEEGDAPPGVSGTIHTSETPSPSPTRTNTGVTGPEGTSNEAEIPMSALGMGLGIGGLGALWYMWSGDTSDDEAPTGAGTSGSPGASTTGSQASTRPAESASTAGSEPDSADKDTSTERSVETNRDLVGEDPQGTHRQGFEEDVTSIRRRLDRADTLMERGDYQLARDRLSDIGPWITSIRESTSDHDADDLHDELVELERRLEDLRSRADE
jgi:hypothetical protein